MSTPYQPPYQPSSVPPQNPYPGGYAQQQSVPPPRMHWALVLLLSIVTVGLFYMVWMILQANWAKKVSGQGKALTLAMAYAGIAVLAMVLNLSSPGSSLTMLLGLANLVTYFLAIFALRAQLQAPPINLSLSGVMTFFFGAIYFQSQLSNYNPGYSGAQQYGQPQYGQQAQFGQGQPQQNNYGQSQPGQWGQQPSAPQPPAPQPGQWAQPAPPQGNQWPPAAAAPPQPNNWPPAAGPTQPTGWPPQQ